MVIEHFSYSPRFSRGTSLIEALVTAAVLGLGLLGIAGLQVAALDNSTDATMRSTASDIAVGLADRMRANKVGAKDGDYVIASAVACGTAPDCSTACSAEGIANADLYEASCVSGVDLLAEGDISVACASGECTITVSWQDGIADSEREQVTLSFVPGEPRQ